jgi:hypothetical protein
MDGGGGGANTLLTRYRLGRDGRGRASTYNYSTYSQNTEYRIQKLMTHVHKITNVPVLPYSSLGLNFFDAGKSKINYFRLWKKLALVIDVACIRNHYVPRHINRRYINTYYCRFCGSVLHSTQWGIGNASLQPGASSSKVRLGVYSNKNYIF